MWVKKNNLFQNSEEFTGLKKLDPSRPASGDFQKLIDIAAAKHGFKKTFKAIQICQEYRNFVKEKFSEKAFQKIPPISYSNSILTIGAVDSAWAQKVMMNQHLITQRLNDKFGASTIAKVRVKLQKT